MVDRCAAPWSLLSVSDYSHPILPNNHTLNFTLLVHNTCYSSLLRLFVSSGSHQLVLEDFIPELTATFSNTTAVIFWVPTY